MYDRKWNKSLYPILIDLHKEFIELHTEAAPFLNGKDSIGRVYAEHIAAISIFSVAFKLGNPLHEGWGINFIKKASEEERLRFTNQLKFFLRDNEDIRSNIVLVWNNYLKPYWELRTLGKPVPLSQKESRSLIEWLPFLGSLFPEGVKFVLETSEDLLAFQGYQHVDVYRHLATSELLGKYTNDAGRLIRHLVRNKALNPYHFKDVHECLAALSDNNVDNSILKDICAYLSEAGDTEARNYLPESVS